MFGMDPDVPVGPRLIERTDPAFPARLSDLAVPPRVLWVQGRTPVEGEPAVAVVGSRAASQAACARVNELAADLARTGFAVVSGGALGIDAAAHRGALAASGVTFAVLGCGIDVVYPDRHVDLFRQISARGGLLSEYGPGVSPRPGQFPARNRLVAALAGAVIVGESRGGSGALITARLASALGRPLLAIAGSAGTDGLLARGAAVQVESAADVIAALGDKGNKPDKSGPSGQIPAKFRDLIAALCDGPAAADVIAARSGLPLGEVLGALFEAELSGLVARVSGGRFEVPRGH